MSISTASVINTINQIIAKLAAEDPSISEYFTCPEGTLNDLDFTCMGPLLGPNSSQFHVSTDGMTVNGNYNLILGNITNGVNFTIDETTDVVPVNSKKLNPASMPSPTGIYTTTFTASYYTNVGATITANATASVYVPPYCTPTTCVQITPSMYVPEFCVAYDPIPHFHGCGCQSHFGACWCAASTTFSCLAASGPYTIPAVSACTPEICSPPLFVKNLSANNVQGSLEIIGGVATGDISFEISYTKPIINSNTILYSLGIPDSSVAFPTFYLSNVSFSNLSISFSSATEPTFYFEGVPINDPKGWGDQEILNIINSYGISALENLLNEGFNNVVIQVYDQF